MAEKDLRRHVVRMLKKLDAVAVENPAYPGTPDVNFVEGWIELKQADRWPARDDRILRIPHFTKEQQIWLRRRHYRGGNALLLLQVGREWLLFDGNTASELVGRATRLELTEKAKRHWSNRPTAKEFIECVQTTSR